MFTPVIEKFKAKRGKRPCLAASAELPIRLKKREKVPWFLPSLGLPVSQQCLLFVEPSSKATDKGVWETP